MKSKRKENIEPRSMQRLVILRMSEVFGLSFARTRAGRMCGNDMEIALNAGKLVKMSGEPGYPVFEFVTGVS